MVSRGIALFYTHTHTHMLRPKTCVLGPESLTLDDSICFSPVISRRSEPGRLICSIY